MSHKSDAGGVALNITDGAALEAAWHLMQDTVAARRPGLLLDGILVEPMSPRGVEVILGARNDPDWGPVIMVGIGGVMAEIMHDARLLPADLDAVAIAAEIRKLRAAALFDGFRGDVPRDVEAVAQMASALGAFVRRHPEIVEVDVNPVMVLEKGKGAIALDAVIVTRVTD